MSLQPTKGRRRLVGTFMLEKRFPAVSPQSFTANGSTAGVVTITDTSPFKVKQKVHLAANTLGGQELEVKRVLSATQLVVGPSGGSITAYTDVSAYTTALSATISANEQLRPAIPADEYNRASYDEEPTVAQRTILVDKLGKRYDDNYPLPVNASVTIDSISIDAVKIKGPSGDFLEVNPDGTIDVNAAVVIPPGIATEAKQDAGNASLASIDGKIPAAPSQEHVAANSPHSTRLTDGTTFYKATTPTDTQPISAAALPLPAGAATAAKQDTGNTSVASIDTKTPALISGRVPVDGSGVTQPVSGPLTDAQLRAAAVPVSGTFFQATQPISAATLPLPAGAATSANQSSELTKLDTLHTDLVTVEGKQDTGNTSLGSIDTKLSNQATAANQATEIATLVSIDTKTPTLVGGRQPVDGSGVTQPISAATLPLPTGAATETTLAGIKTGTDKIPTSPSQEHIAANSPHAARLTDGTAFYKATTPTDTQPVSAASLPLPTGASTAAKQDVGNTSLDSIDNKSTNFKTLTFGPTLGALDLILFEIDTEGWGGAFINFLSTTASGTGANEATMQLEYRNDTTSDWLPDSFGFKSMDGTPFASTHYLYLDLFDIVPIHQAATYGSVTIIPKGRYIRGRVVTYINPGGDSNYSANVTLKKVTPTVLPSVSATTNIANAFETPIYSNSGAEFTSVTFNGAGQQSDILGYGVGTNPTTGITGGVRKTFALQVKATGSVTSWDVRLEGSLDALSYTTILQHTNVTPGDGLMIATGALLVPVTYFRARANALTLGAGTDINVTIIGT